MIRVGKHTEAKSVNIFHQFNDSKLLPVVNALLFHLRFQTVLNSYS